MSRLISMETALRRSPSTIPSLWMMFRMRTASSSVRSFTFVFEIDAGFLTDLGRPALADSINVGQTDLNPFVQRQIHSCDSSQCFPLNPFAVPLSLTLLVLGIGAQNLDDSLAAHDLALGAYFFD